MLIAHFEGRIIVGDVAQHHRQHRRWAGDIVPADGRVIDSPSLLVDEATAGRRVVSGLM
jgi:magnesium-transporting ATPase (P-type)